MNYKNFVFDLDGTLIKTNNKVVDGAPELFTRILTNIPEANICIASGASLFEVERAIKLIKKQMPEDLEFNPIIVAHGGSYISRNGSTIKCALTPNEILEMTKKIRSVDQNCLVDFRSPETNFRIEEALVPEMQEWFESLPKCISENIEQKTKTYLDANSFANNVFGLEVLTFKLDEMFDALKEKFGSEYLIVTKGACVEVNKVGKINALKVLFGNLKDTVYFGDGANDVPCFLQCGLSIGIGLNEYTKYAHTQVNNMFEASEVLFN